jgi:hypothetical protein
MRNLPGSMRSRKAIAGLILALVVAGALFLILGSDGDEGPQPEMVPGRPTVSVVSPRNGSRQGGRAVVVRVDVANFLLAPRHFGGPPQLGEGHIRFSLNRVPDCVDPAKLERALNSPLSSGRLIGRSLDYPAWSGPNGLLAKDIGSMGDYSPATRPEIYYHGLPPGFYRLRISLAQNNGVPTPFHAVTNFEVVRTLRGPGPKTRDCQGKISSADAASQIK